MLGSLDLAPRVARHVPALGGFVLQRIEVLGFAGQQVEHHGVLEQAPGVALADELLQVRPEEGREDRIGFGVDQRLHHGAGVDLAQRRGLLADELHAGLGLGHQFLERSGGRLAVLVVRVDDGPLHFIKLDRVGDQHRRLHVGRGAQAEGVVVAVFPYDLVGQGLGGHEHDLALLGQVGDREADVGGESSHQQTDVLARDQLLGHAHRVAGVAVVVARDHLDLAAEHAAGLVDLLQRELPALLVGIEEGREDLVAVQLADLDRLRLGGSSDQEHRGKHCVPTFHLQTPSVVLLGMVLQPGLALRARSPVRAIACRSAGRKIFS